MSRKQTSHLILGQKGESEAALYLEQKGVWILERNFRCKLGEIDIVGLTDHFLVFIEVKTRKRNGTNTSPLISLTQTKRRKLRRLGEFYRIQKRILDKQPRFDAIGITYQNEKQFCIEHIENAF